MGRVQKTEGQETHPLFPFCLTTELDPLLIFSCSWIGIYITGSPGSQDFELGLNYYGISWVFPDSSVGEESACNAGTEERRRLKQPSVGGEGHGTPGEQSSSSLSAGSPSPSSCHGCARAGSWDAPGGLPPVLTITVGA